MNRNTFKPIQEGHVIINHSKFSLQITNSVKKTIDRIWSEEQERATHSYNAGVLSLIDIKNEGNNIILTAGFTDYKKYSSKQKKKY